MSPSTNKEIKLLSIVLSFRNEQEVLPELVKQLRKVLTQTKCSVSIRSYELLFVNDNSTDHSLSVLNELAKNFSDIKIINMSRRFGVAPCILAGMEFSQGDMLVYMDCDLQDPPEVIIDLIETWASEENIEVVHTVRLSRKGESKLKLFLTRIGYLILNKLSTPKLPIEAGDFKLLSRRAVNHIIQFREKNPYVRGIIGWIGFKQVSVPYHRNARFSGKTKFQIYSRGVINNFLESALISFSSAPLKISIYMGMFALFIDFVVMGHAFYEKITGSAVPGWTALMIVVLFFSGVQLMSIGIIGLYINSIHEQGKNRPNYIVESTLGFGKMDDVPNGVLSRG